MDTLSTIEVTGDDAFEFLQGQLSNDLRRLENEPAILSAWCNPKGRVICLIRVTGTEGGYACTLPAEMAESVVKRMTMFRFRAKVDFAIVAPETTLTLTDAIERGEAYIGREQSEKFTPHMLNLDLLDAISLDKGCYTGQEVVARTHYKGATKRRTLRFESEAPVSVGDKVSDGDRSIGEVLNVSGNALLAVVSVDRAGSPLTVNGIALTLQPLPYSIDPEQGTPRA